MRTPSCSTRTAGPRCPHESRPRLTLPACRHARMEAAGRRGAARSGSRASRFCTAVRRSWTRRRPGCRQTGLGVLRRYLALRGRDRRGGACTLSRRVGDAARPAWSNACVASAMPPRLRAWRPMSWCSLAPTSCPRSLLAVPRLGTINAHYGLLPAYRGHERHRVERPSRRSDRRHGPSRRSRHGHRRDPPAGADLDRAGGHVRDTPPQAPGPGRATARARRAHLARRHRASRCRSRRTRDASTTACIRRCAASPRAARLRRWDSTTAGAAPGPGRRAAPRRHRPAPALRGRRTSAGSAPGCVPSGSDGAPRDRRQALRPGPAWPRARAARDRRARGAAGRPGS